MKLKHLSVNLEEWGAEKGQYTGRAIFVNEHGSIEIKLADTISYKMLELCAEALVEQAQRTGQILVSNVLENTHALAAPGATQELD